VCVCVRACVRACVCVCVCVFCSNFHRSKLIYDVFYRIYKVVKRK